LLPGGRQIAKSHEQPCVVETHAKIATRGITRHRLGVEPAGARWLIEFCEELCRLGRDLVVEHRPVAKFVKDQQRLGLFPEFFESANPVEEMHVIEWRLAREPRARLHGKFRQLRLLEN
jgi:hypothetical protein